MKLPPSIYKLIHWEYWPSYIFYIPIFPYYILKALQSKGFAFVLATNPAIKFSGIGTESKYDVMQIIPKHLQTKTILIRSNISLNNILKQLKDAQICFPLIAKPDIGFRGLLVSKINTEEALKKYLENKNVDILLQEFLDYKYECGVFYSRIPGEEKGKITSITLKKFLILTGNGINTVEELIKKHPRAYLYFKIFKKNQKNNLIRVPKQGEEIKLSSIGNHSKGTQFINGNHLICKELEESFDSINKQISGWYYGRFDIKYNDFKDLIKGCNFKIIELNGLLAEPTHIYDSKKGSYLSALKSILYHWRIINTIAKKNLSVNTINAPSFNVYKKELIFLYNYVNKLKHL